MTVKRISPKILEDSKAMSAVSTSVTAGKVSETARVSNNIDGECPICHKQLQPTMANGNPVLACLQHAIVMPTRD
jgi:hypothetical protein